MRLVLAAVLWMSLPATLLAQSAFAIRNVRVFDGRQVAEHRTVLVENGKISKIGGAEVELPTNAEAIDGTGKTLLPGLIDAHVHLSDNPEADLQQAAAFGVTTVIDMFTAGTRFERIKVARSADAPGLADLRTAGVGATAPGGHPSQMGGGAFPTVADSASAASFVDTRFREGSDFLKIIYDDVRTFGPLPMLSRGTLGALVQAAHAHQRLAVVHVSTEDQARAAIEAGADGLAHLYVALTSSPRLVKVIAERKAFVIPTLTIEQSMCGQFIGSSLANDSLLRAYIPPQWRSRLSMTFKAAGGPWSCEGTNAMIRELASKGVPILTGTDSPIPGQTYGVSVQGEMSLLVAAGLTPAEALTAATAAPAEAFRLTDRGYIRPGLRADLLLVDGDPTADILATRRIVAVWKRGVRINRVRYPDDRHN